MKSVYKKLVSFGKAVQLARETIKPLDETENIPITESSGRILSQSVFAPRNNPPFNRSTMDGYAVRSRDIADINETDPAILKITGESFIGQPRKEMACEGCCFRISTGAIIPSGADAVVRVEDTEETGDEKVRIFVSVSSGTNIAESGSDISGQELLTLAGKVVDTNDIAVFASLGIPEVEVYRKLKITVISTGNELIAYNGKYREGSINDANGIALCNELNNYSFIDTVYAGIVPDDYNQIKEKIDENLTKADIVILSGGSSAGESDLVYRIIDEMSPGMIFHGVLVKPGLPTVLGQSGNKVVIGLPGFPVSSMMIFRSIFLQAILSAGGLNRQPASLRGVLAVNLKLEMGRQNLIPVSVAPGEPSRIYPVTGLSGSISRFMSTSGFISLEGDTKFLEAGTETDVILWEQNLEDRRPVISGIVLRTEAESDVTEHLSSFRYQRMNPRESLKSLKNRDSSISSFFFTEGFSVREYVKTEFGNDEFFIYEGHRMEVGILSTFSMKTMDEVFESIQKGVKITGPAIRFLENIVSDNKVLHRLLQEIRENLSSYLPSGLKYDSSHELEDKNILRICCGIPEDLEGKSWIRAFDIIPVFVTEKKGTVENLPHLNEFLKLLED